MGVFGAPDVFVIEVSISILTVIFSNDKRLSLFTLVITYHVVV